jgi:transcriptional regulator with XRE-family HTH domain
VLREFGPRLAVARKRKGLKQLALGRCLGLSRTSISNIERGEQRISLEFAYQAAFVLEVSLQDLLPTLEEVEPSQDIGHGVRVHTASDEIPLVYAAEEETLKMIEELRKRPRKKAGAGAAPQKGKRS